MPTYRCNICRAEFNRKSSYDSHIKKKNPCYPFREVADGEKKNYGCEFCDKVFTTKNNLKKHINLAHKEMMVENYNEKKVTNNDGVYQNIKNNHNCTFNTKIDKRITNNFKINVYGDEQYNIKPETWKKILNQGFTSSKVFTELIHFNKSKPENHNVYISNLRAQYVHIYTANGWESRYIDEFIDNFLEDKEYTIFEIFDQMQEDGNLGQRIIRKMTRYKDSCEENRIKNRNKRALKLLFYNKRKLPMEIKKMMESV